MLKKGSRTEIDKLNRDQAVGAAVGTFLMALGAMLSFLVKSLNCTTVSNDGSQIAELVLIIGGVVLGLGCIFLPAIRLRGYYKTHRKPLVIYPKKVALDRRKHYARITVLTLLLIVINVVIVAVTAKNEVFPSNSLLPYVVMLTPVIVLSPIMAYNGTRLSDFLEALRGHKTPKVSNEKQDFLGIIVCLIALAIVIAFTVYIIVS